MRRGILLALLLPIVAAVPSASGVRRQGLLYPVVAVVDNPATTWVKSTVEGEKSGELVVNWGSGAYRLTAWSYHYQELLYAAHDISSYTVIEEASWEVEVYGLRQGRWSLIGVYSHGLSGFTHEWWGNKLVWSEAMSLSGWQAIKFRAVLRAEVTTWAKACYAYGGIYLEVWGPGEDEERPSNVRVESWLGNGLMVFGNVTGRVEAMPLEGYTPLSVEFRAPATLDIKITDGGWIPIDPGWSRFRCKNPDGTFLFNPFYMGTSAPLTGRYLVYLRGWVREGSLSLMKGGKEVWSITATVERTFEDLAYIDSRGERLSISFSKLNRWWGDFNVVVAVAAFNETVKPVRWEAIYGGSRIGGSEYGGGIALPLLAGGNYTIKIYYEYAAGRSVPLGAVFYLPGERILGPLYDEDLSSPGIWKISVHPYFDGVEPLVAHVYDPNNREEHYIELNGELEVNVSSPWRMIKDSCLRGDTLVINDATLRLLPKICGGQCAGCIYLGLSAWNPSKSIYRPGFLGNGTTVAVYRVTYEYSGASTRTVYTVDVIVSSLKISLECLYLRDKVTLRWHAQYRYLPPSSLLTSLHASVEPPRQSLYVVLENGSEVLFAWGTEQASTSGPDLIISAEISSDTLSQISGGKQVLLKAGVRWRYPNGGIGNPVYGCEPLILPIVPCTLTLLNFTTDPLHAEVRFDLWKDVYGMSRLSLEDLPPYAKWSGEVRVDVALLGGNAEALFEDVGVKAGVSTYSVNLDVDASSSWVSLYAIPISETGLPSTWNVILYVMPTRI